MTLTRKSAKRSQACCSRPAYQGLQNLERPRFFPGQLLSEAELNSQQAYVLAKNRLHNRYLHGWGVVCGLEVVYHDECEGWVTVRPGYGIDPCGNDIIVSQAHDFDVLTHIRDCLEAQRRQRRADCDPIQPARQEACPEDKTHWCLTLACEEKEARPVPALHRSSAQVGRGTGQTPVACEPTRIVECYRLGLIEAPEECCWDPRALLPAGSLEELPPDLLDLLDDTLLARVIHCLASLQDFVVRRIGKEACERIWNVVEAPAEAVYPAASILHDDCVNLRRAVCKLYRENPQHIQCAPLGHLAGTACERPEQGEVGGAYAKRVRPTMQRLVSLLVQYALDCICRALLPPCPPDPADGRLILACITVEKVDETCKIVRICDFSCRRYAGAFPSLSHWLSLVPIIPLLGQAANYLCCHMEAGELLTRLIRSGFWDEVREAICNQNYAPILALVRRVFQSGRQPERPEVVVAARAELETVRQKLQQTEETLATLQKEVETLRAKGEPKPRRRRSSSSGTEKSSPDSS
jgi:hypothetical protein